MNIELCTINDGGVMLVADRPFAHDVQRVEFYRDQRLFLLVYSNDHADTDLMHYEIPNGMIDTVEKSPDVIIFSMFPDAEPSGYKVPLIKVGNIF